MSRSPWVRLNFLEANTAKNPALASPPHSVCSFFSGLDLALDNESPRSSSEQDDHVLLDMQAELEVVGWLAAAEPGRFWIGELESGLIRVERTLVAELAASRGRQAPTPQPRPRPTGAAAAAHVAQAIAGWAQTATSEVDELVDRLFAQQRPAASAASEPPVGRVLFRLDDGCLLVDMLPHLEVLGWLALHRPRAFAVCANMAKLAPQLIAELTQPRVLRAADLVRRRKRSAAAPPADAWRWPSQAAPELDSLLESVLDARARAAELLPARGRSPSELARLALWSALEPLEVLTLALVDYLLRPAPAEPSAVLDVERLLKADDRVDEVNYFFRRRAQLLSAWRCAVREPSLDRLAALASALEVDNGLLLLERPLLLRLLVALVSLVLERRQSLCAYVALREAQHNSGLPVLRSRRLPVFTS